MAVSACGDAEIQVRLAGVFSVLRHGVPVGPASLGSRKARRLLKLLAVQRANVVAVDRVVRVLWAGHPPARAADNVATLVSRLRRELGGGVIDGGRDGYRLGSPPAVAVDLDLAARWTGQARERLAAGEPGLALAAANQAMDLLAGGSALADEPDADWAEPARDQFAALLGQARLVLARAAYLTGEYALARTAARDAVAADPYDEAAHRVLMRAHQALGEPARALAAYAELRERLGTELGADPAGDTQELHLAILRGEREREVEAAPARPAADAGAEPPGLVGRQAELRRLREAWVAAAAGVPATLLVVGEAGIGKTRLTEEFVRIARGTGGTVLFARCYETERSLFLQPVVEALASAIRGMPLDTVRAAAGEAAAALADLVPAASFLGSSPPPVRRTAPEVERRRAFEAVTAFVRGLCVRAPVVLVLDDLHNAGRATVELLHYLARHAAGSRLLIVATVRSGEGHALDPLAEVATAVRVGALPAEAVTRLAAAAGHPELAGSIMRRTRGHTLYVVETLRGLAAGDTGVPASLQEAVLARVRHAGRPVEDLLRTCAVLGAAFDPVTAAALLGEALPRVAARCQDALAAGLIVAAGRDYEFGNDLVREVLNATTPEPTRRAYHLLAADLLTGRPEAVAGHASAAGDWPRAARAWLLAGEEALRRFAVDDAVDLFDRGVEVAGLVGDLEVRGRALLGRARAREARAAYEQALADLHAAVATAREAGDQRLEMVALRALGGDTPIALGRPIGEATAHLHRGLRIATALGDRAMEADLLAWLAIIACNGLRFAEAADDSARAVLAARASASEEALAAALDGRKTFLAYLGEVRDLRTVVDELEPLLHRRGDLFRLHWTLFESGFAAVAGGDWPAAAARFEVALEANRRSGFTAYESWHLAHLGWLARLQGRYDQALALGGRAVELAAKVPHAWCAAVSAAQLGATLLETGAVDEAVTVLEHGRGQVGQDGSEAYLLRCLGPLAEATGSRELLDEADRMLAGISAPAGSAWLAGDGVYLAVARSWLAHGEPGRARDVLAPMLSAAGRIPWVAPLAEGCLVDGRAAAALGHLEEGHALVARASDLARRYGLPGVARAAAG